MDIDDSNSNRSLRQTIYNQLDYVLRHITNQGKNCWLESLIMLKELNKKNPTNEKVVLGLTQRHELLSKY